MRKSFLSRLSLDIILSKNKSKTSINDNTNSKGNNKVNGVSINSSAKDKLISISLADLETKKFQV